MILCLSSCSPPRSVLILPYHKISLYRHQTFNNYILASCNKGLLMSVVKKIAFSSPFFRSLRKCCFWLFLTFYWKKKINNNNQILSHLSNLHVNAFWLQLAAKSGWLHSFLPEVHSELRYFSLKFWARETQWHTEAGSLYLDSHTLCMHTYSIYLKYSKSSFRTLLFFLPTWG